MKKRFTVQLLGAMLCVALLLCVLPMQARAETTLSKDADGYYLIGNEADLFAFAALVSGGEVGANGKLTANITMTGESKPWTPIALTRTDKEAYAGTFDGQGYTIKNLYFNDVTVFTAGLFGYVNNGTVKNVTIADGYIAAIWGGAVAGRFFGTGRIENCGNLNTTVTAGEVGGIVGITDSSIYACWNTGSISGDTWAGGICAYLQSPGTLKGCWNSGEIRGERVGGIVGAVGGARTVTHCYNDGVVVADDNDLEGAIIGSNNGSGRPKMSNCYYTWPRGGAYKAYGEEYDYYFDNVDDVDSSMLPTGAAAYLMNEGLAGTGCQFYQNLDNGKPVDSYPVPNSTHGKVYRGYKACAADVGYSNSPLAQAFYHSGITYEKDGSTVREICTNPSCPNATRNLGSVTLKASDAYYTGLPIAAAVDGSLTAGGSYKLTYNAGSANAPSEVGKHTVTMTVSEGGAVKQTVTETFEISYLPAPALSEFAVAGHSYYADGVYWFKSGADAVIMPSAGHTVSTALDGTYGDSVTLSASGSKTVYLKRTSDGAMTDAIELGGILQYDAAAPTGELKLSSGNAWTGLKTKTGFGLFFKDAKTATVTAQDTDSGVKGIAYYIAQEDLIGDSTLNSASAVAVLETAIADGWVPYNSAIALDLNTKSIIYARITDNVGNVTYLSSDGIVLYTDAAADTASVEATYKAGQDRVLQLKLNGNTVHSVSIGSTALVDGKDYTVADGKLTLKAACLDALEAGDHTVTITYDPLGESYVEGGNNESPAKTEIPLHIAKATYDMSAAKWNYTGAFRYNGLERTVTVVGLPSGVTVSGYTGNTATVVGSYTAKAVLSYDADNYNAIVMPDLSWSIVNDWTPIEFALSTPNANGWLNTDFVITAKDGYKVSLTNTAAGSWEAALTYDGETADGSVTFYLKNEADGTISLEKTVTYKLDKTPATGKVEFVERSTLEALVNALTFDRFFKEEVTVKAAADDTLSGVASVEYFASETAMTLDEAKAAAQWTAMPADGVPVPVKNGKQFVYFVRITDNAGNETYLFTDGAEYDTKAPVISGIRKGRTYYTEKTVTVTDKNLDTVTVNGEIVTDPIVLSNETTTTYTVVATDKAGNQTTVTVKLRPAIFNPATGDESNLWLWAVLMCASGCAMAALVVYDRKRRMKNN